MNEVNDMNEMNDMNETKDAGHALACREMTPAFEARIDPLRSELMPSLRVCLIATTLLGIGGCGLRGGRYYTSSQANGELVVEIHEPDGKVIHTTRAALGAGNASQTIRSQDGTAVERVETTLEMRRAGKDK